MTYKAVLFDAYGTILDVDSAAATLASSGRFPALKDRWPELAALWRARQRRIGFFFIADRQPTG